MLPFAAGKEASSLSQAAVLAASGILHLLQQHKTLLPQKAFALHSAGAIGGGIMAPHAPQAATGPMAAAAAMGVLKGLPFELPTMTSAPVDGSAQERSPLGSRRQLVVVRGRFDAGRCVTRPPGQTPSSCRHKYKQTKPLQTRSMVVEGWTQYAACITGLIGQGTDAETGLTNYLVHLSCGRWDVGPEPYGLAVRGGTWSRPAMSYAAASSTQPSFLRQVCLHLNPSALAPGVAAWQLLLTMTACTPTASWCSLCDARHSDADGIVPWNGAG